MVTVWLRGGRDGKSIGNFNTCAVPRIGELVNVSAYGFVKVTGVIHNVVLVGDERSRNGEPGEHLVEVVVEKI